MSRRYTACRGLNLNIANWRSVSEEAKFYLVSYMGDHDSKNYKYHEKSNLELIKTSKETILKQEGVKTLSVKLEVELHLWRQLRNIKDPQFKLFEKRAKVTRRCLL